MASYFKMKHLKVLIVEGNTHEENLKFQKLSNQPQSFNFKDNIKKYYPDTEIDIVNPSTKNETEKSSYHRHHRTGWKLPSRASAFPRI